MKNMNDVHARLEAELEQWFIKQVRNEFADFYLYYLPTTAEHIGGFLILENPPANPEYQLVERVKRELSIEQNLRRFLELSRRLPILEIE